jgi:hypothetical protein
MEKEIMSKTNDTAATRVLTDSELDTIAGGLPPTGEILIEILRVPPPPPPAWYLWPIW